MQEWLLRRYRAHGASYLALCLWIPAAVVLLVVPPISTAVLSRYDGLSLPQWCLSLAAAEGPIVLALVAGWRVGRRDIKVVSRWASGERGEFTPAEVAAAVRRLPRRILTTVAVLALGLGGPAGALTTLAQVDHIDVTDLLALVLAAALYVTWAIVAVLVWAEIAMRPVLHDVVQSDPCVSNGGVLRYQLRAQIAGAVASAVLIGALYSGAMVSTSDRSLTDLVQLIGYAIVVTLFFAAVLVPLYLEWLAEPLRELTRASRRVGAGDMTVRVAVTSNDEIGELSQAFNAMVDGLAERDELRAMHSALAADLRESRRRLVAASDSARRHVETDLHDGAQQQLALARLKVTMLGRRIAAGEHTAAALDELEASIEGAIDELNELAQGIYPERLEADGIRGALEHALTFVPHPAHLEADGIGRYRPQVESAVYFCCREAFQNVTKHAGENATISVELRENDGMLIFVVADDGVGFAAESAASPTTASSGLQNITDRLSSLHGAIEIASVPGRGTTLTGRVPLA